MLEQAPPSAPPPPPPPPMVPGTPVPDIGAFVKYLAETGMYYIFIFEGMEWKYLLGTLTDDYFPQGAVDPDAGSDVAQCGRLLTDEDKGVHYFIKARMPVGALIDRLGVTRKQLSEYKALRLLYLDSGQVKPTVVGYGSA